MSVPQPCARGPSLSTDTMPALLERPKLSNAMARALHRHIMMERERKRQGEPGRGLAGARGRAGCGAVLGVPRPGPGFREAPWRAPASARLLG